MKRPDEFTLDVQSIQCSLEALDVLREAFEDRSLTQGLSKKDFAEWIGKDASYVSRVLNGRATNVNIMTIARMLIALGYWPSLDLQDMEALDEPSNYKASEIERDDFERVSTKQWRSVLNDAERDDARHPSVFKKICA